MPGPVSFRRSAEQVGLAGQDHVTRHGNLAGAPAVVVPVHPEQVPRVRLVRLHPGQRAPDARRDGLRRGQLAERGQQDARLTKPADVLKFTLIHVDDHKSCNEYILW